MLIYRRPWTHQPQGAVRIDGGNALARGLKFLAIPYGGGWLDIYSGVLAINTNSQSFSKLSQSPKFAGSRTGAMTQGVTGGHFKWPAQLPVDLIVGPSTTFVEGSMSTEPPAGSIGAVFNTGDVVVGSGWTIGFDDSVVVNNGWRYTSNTGGAGTSVSSTNNVLDTSAEFFTHRIAASFDGTNVRLFANGRFDTSAAATAPISHATRRTRIMAGYTQADSSGLRTAISIAAVWDRALSDEEVAAVSVNPWQLFAPLPQKLWLPDTGPTGIPVLSAAGATSITATTATPQVTLTF
jgi:hypothetical protein